MAACAGEDLGEDSYFGVDRLCGSTSTGFGPGLFPGPGHAGVFGVDRLCGFTGAVFGAISPPRTHVPPRYQGQRQEPAIASPGSGEGFTSASLVRFAALRRQAAVPRLAELADRISDGRARGATPPTAQGRRRLSGLGVHSPGPHRMPTVPAPPIGPIGWCAPDRQRSPPPGGCGSCSSSTTI